MAETFNDKDYLIIDEISYRFQEPRRGQVVVFRAPKDPSQYYLKRIIGLPGETVEVTNTHVRIKNEQQPDGFFLDEEQYLQGKPTLNEQVVTLGEDEYFVMGDNREQSLDSRVFGPVPEEFIVGKVWVRGWPLNQAGFIEETLY
jgi:signal peptidase I